MKKQTKTAGILLATILLSISATAQDTNWEQIQQDDQLQLEPSASSNQTEELTRGSSRINGTLHLELNITPKTDSSSYRTEILDFSMNERDTMKVGTIRATGFQGSSHSIELLNSRGDVIKSRSFRLYSESVVNRRYAENGSYAPSKYVKEYYPRHVFNFANNYSARKIRVKGSNIETVEIRVPQRVCDGDNYPYYCEYNNFTETEDGDMVGIYEPESVKISIWDRLIRLVQSLLDLIPLL